MSRRVKGCMVTILIGIICMAAPPTTDAIDARDIASRHTRSVVALIAQDEANREIGYGTGFFVEEDLVATSLHVLQGASAVVIARLDTGTQSPVLGVVATDARADLALVRVPIKGAPLIVADDKQIRVGDKVFVIGNPQGMEGTLSDGIVSALREAEAIRRIQITAPVSPGSSGGPVLDDRGHVIGVTTASIARSQNLNFAIGSNHLRSLLGRVGPAVSLPLSPAGATVTDLPGWGNTTWGMSVEQARQALQLRGSPTPPHGSGPLYPAFSITTSIDRFDYVLALSFDLHSHTLEQVYFSPKDREFAQEAFLSLKALLTDKYGRPNEREMLVLGVRRIRISEWVFPTTVISLEFGVRIKRCGRFRICQSVLLASLSHLVFPARASARAKKRHREALANAEGH